MMDDQGAGGSQEDIDREGLPEILQPLLYDAPRYASFQRIPPPMVLDWPSQPTRSRSQDHGRSLPSPSRLLRQTESTFDDHIVLSRSLDASPVNPILLNNRDLPLPRLVVQRPPPPPVNGPPRSTRDHSMGGYSYTPMTRSMSMSPHGSHSRPYSHAPPYGPEPTSRTPQPLQSPSRQIGPSPGVQDVLVEDAWPLPQPEVPVRPPRDPYAELRGSPGFVREQRGRSEVRANHISHMQRLQVQDRDHQVDLEQGRVEGSQRDPQRQVESFPSRSIRERRPPFGYPTNPFEEQQRLQRPLLQPQRQQVHHQPQPQQPMRFSQLLSGPGYLGGMGASSSSQSASSSRSQTISNFAGELYSEGQSEIKPLYQRSSITEPPAIDIQEAKPERKKAQRSPMVKKRPRTPMEDGRNAGTSTGATTSTRRKPLTKVAVACGFCRARKLKCDGQKPCANCSGRDRTPCDYPPAPRRRGPGKAPKRTKAEMSRQRLQQQQKRRRVPPPHQSQMSIGAGSPGPSSGPSPTAFVPARSPLTLGGRGTTGPSQSPGVSTSEMETGSRAGSRRRLSGSSAEEPERKRSRIREFKGEEEGP